MEEIFELYKYLPIFPQEEQEYVEFLKAEIEKGYNAKVFQSAYLTIHMMFMFFVYCCIWKIKMIYNERYCYGIIGFPKYRDDNNNDVDLRKLHSIFNLSLVAEKTVFDVFQLVEMDRSEIARLKNTIDKRNKIAHSTGQINFYSKEVFAEGVLEILNNCEMINRTMEKNLIRPAYETFLISNRNPEEWEYSDISEQVLQSLLYTYKLSEIELKTCFEFGTSRFSNRSKYNLSMSEIKTIMQLHNKTKNIYAEYFGVNEFV